MLYMLEVLKALYTIYVTVKIAPWHTADLSALEDTGACISLGFTPINNMVLWLRAAKCLDISANRHCLAHDVKHAIPNFW